MLEILNEKAQKENIDNIKTIEEDLSKITIDNVGKHDIVVASKIIEWNSKYKGNHCKY